MVVVRTLPLTRLLYLQHAGTWQQYVRKMLQLFSLKETYLEEE